MQIAGVYFDGKTSVAHPAHLKSLGDMNFIIEIAESSISTTGKFRPMIGNSPLTLELEGGGSFQSSDISFPQLKESLVGFDWIQWLESKFRIALLSVVVVFGIIIFCYVYVFPLAADKISKQVPNIVSEKISAETIDVIEKSKMVTSTSLSVADQFKVQMVFNKLRAFFPNLSLNLLLRNGRSIGANAFALPDGTIYVTDQIAAKLTNDELLSVLCHEVGHVVNRHGIRSLIESSALSVILLSVSGTIDWTGLPLALLTSGYSRKFETEADDFSVVTLKAHQMNGALLADALSKIDKPDDKKSSRIFELLMSHPSTKERVERIRHL